MPFLWPKQLPNGNTIKPLKLLSIKHFISLKINKVSLGASFIMATAAVGPGFITQTAAFTIRLGVGMFAVVLISILIDILIQLNIWKTLIYNNLRFSEFAKSVFGKGGTLMVGSLVLGGLLFNIGNIAGLVMGWQWATGWSAFSGIVFSLGLVTVIFLVRSANRLVDVFAQVVGVCMLGLLLYSGFKTEVPWPEFKQTEAYASGFDLFAILTLVGGTVGGYISYAGAHRFLDSGIFGRASAKAVSQSARRGILISGIIRILLFLVVLGTIYQFPEIRDHPSPAGEVFERGLGETGRRIFGMLLWCASITSLVGCTYTSISFVKNPGLKSNKWWPIFFLAGSIFLYLTIQNPSGLLVWAGTLNAWVLPISIGMILVYTKKHHHQYQPPLVQRVALLCTALLLAFAAVYTLIK